MASTVPWLAHVGLLVPQSIADALYRTIARFRYRVFGQPETCPIPPVEWRDRFRD